MILFVFTWFFIPETRGMFQVILTQYRTGHAGEVLCLLTALMLDVDRTLEEIHEMFEAKLPARKFKGYVCVGVEKYAADAVGEKGAEKVGAVQVERVSVEA